MKKGIIKRNILFVILVALLLNPVTVYAEEGVVRFGSEFYEYENGKSFPIGVYIEGAEPIGKYEVIISYDANRMKYVEGGNSEEAGIITLEGSTTRDNFKYMLYFKAISGGEAYVQIDSVKVFAEGEDAEESKYTFGGKTAIYISGEDTVAETAVEPQEQEEEAEESQIPVIGSEKEIGGVVYSLVDLSKYEVEEQLWNGEVVEGTLNDNPAMFYTSQEGNGNFLYFVDEEENFKLYGYCDENQKIYSCSEIKSNGQQYFLTHVNVAKEWPEGLTEDTAESQGVYFCVNKEGESGFYCIKDQELVKWEDTGFLSFMQHQFKVFKWIAIVAALVLGGTLLATVIIYLVKNGKSKKTANIQNDDMKIIDLEQDGAVRDEEKPVISVKNVSMIFRVSTSSASGVKEYLIQLLKKQVTYRELKALDHVSFDVYKGEVVGIIGTNGSGKSTILRVVSGALKPTGGRVDVDTRKIQLLTLGTGFDMELTARENVYLNGAIIGLSEEFLNEHYQEIVDFAELDGFMEEKVKNFSSGMVSRLGFAIATVGEVSEILILDEVLSVGDEFFRKKSLAKVKEMIHSGSTVLMVSHNMATIIENCTKAVWIEKGKLKLVGDPKVVCAAYRKQNEGK